MATPASAARPRENLDTSSSNDDDYSLLSTSTRPCDADVPKSVRKGTSSSQKTAAVKKENAINGDGNGCDDAKERKKT